MKIEFFVPGHPKTQGSLRSFALKSGGRYTGKVVTPQCDKVISWRGVVSTYALQARQQQGWVLTAEPVMVTLDFHLLRPKAHYRTGNNSHLLKDSVPAAPISIRSGDGDKLTRAVWDALTGVLWADDSQVAMWAGAKHYGHEEGVYVDVRTLDEKGED